MPGFYEGKPAAVVRQKMTGALYTQASLTARRQMFPLTRPGVRAGICVTLALLCLSGTPWYAARYGGVWAPVALEVLLLLLAAFFLFVQPKNEQAQLEKKFSSNPLLALETTASVYRDSVVLENECEKILEYWTEFQRCFETPRYFVAAGGRERYLWVLDKDALSQEECARVSQLLADAFAAKYHRLKV